ncbi:hypothetical protein [Lysobacter enzymogenes]|uniref:hypothetical protein n=1 Tax=Lysobacter enzymogenes TaxID=69 RepID=UPI001A96CCEB|nr:hypothetical protein [Lysobacter enzymogenes]QQP94321.1 hypothetical protein JHW38_13675 [Lysobacter enzymogenes]
MAVVVRPPFAFRLLSPRACAALLLAVACAPAAAGVRLDRAAEADADAPAATEAADARADAGARACMRVLRPVARAQALLAADLRRESCGDKEPVQRAHYDRDAGLVRAPADLAAGDALAAIAPSLLADLRQGDKVALIYRDGAIAISRDGVAARDSKPGAPVRVVLADGAFVTAPSAGAAPASQTPASLQPSSPPSSSRSGETP